MPQDEVSCIATVTDSDNATDTDTQSITLENRAPVVYDAMIFPNPIYTNNTVSASATILDPDGNAITEVIYKWHIQDASNNNNGWIVQLGTSNTLDGLIHFDKDDILSVTVTASDGMDTSSPLSSANHTILNSPPAAPTIHISPSTTTVNQQDLTCSIITESIDVDIDPITYTFKWYDPSNTLWSTSSGSNIFSDILYAADTSVGIWTCEVIPNDGFDDGVSETATIVVEEDCPLTGNGSNPDCSATSCAIILSLGYSTGDGYYWVSPDGVGSIEVYCDMTNEGGGWELAMQVDASSSLFSYDSGYWFNNQTYGSLSNFAAGLDYKSEIFNKKSTDEVMIELESSSTSAVLATTLPQATTLRVLFSQNSFISTSFGRSTWKSFDPNSSLQTCCNREGFNNDSGNVDGIDVRIGIVANDAGTCDCSAPDSYIGIGRSSDSCYQDGVFDLGFPSMAGNATLCENGSYDNGLQNIGVLGRIFVR